MCQKNAHILFFCIILTLPVFGLFEVKGPQWEGKIEKEKGIKIIKNPNEPLFGKIELKLEEDLIIGNEKDENYAFYKTGNVVVDSEGNIFVSDGGNFSIQKFDKDGNYIQTVGRQGEGPGEFGYPMTIYLDKNDNIYANDGNRIQVFDKNGEYVDTITFVEFTRHIFRKFWITKDGNMICDTTSRGDVNVKDF